MANSYKYLFIITVFILNLQFIDGELYKAGVVEYFYDIENSNGASEKDIFFNNLNTYISIIGKFRNADSSIEKGIIVFPECGLTKENVTDAELFIQVPDPSYDHINFSENKVISALSEAASQNKLWVVVNLMEQHGPFRYNTDVVFRSNGTIAARYRKYNLFGEPLNTTSTPEVVSFTTDFGVTFGIFTCFDILYTHPAQDLIKQGIKHFVFPTAWYSELPFLTAIQYQMYWAYANDVTLLASGLSFSPYGNTGSGIYQGKKGPMVYHQTTATSDSYIMSANLDSSDPGYREQEATVLPASQLNINEPADQINYEGLKLLNESLLAYTTELIDAEECSLEKDVNVANLKPNEIVPCTKTLKRTLCNHHLCCNFEVTSVFQISLKGSKNIPKQNQQDDFSFSVHRLAVLDGVRSFVVATGGVQTCAVVPCRDKNVASCGLAPQQHISPYTVIDGHAFQIFRRFITEVKIEGEFLQKEDGEETYITPNLLHGHVSSNDPSSQFGHLFQNFTFSVNKINGKVKFHYGPNDNFEHPVGTAGIWSRVFNRDGQPVSTVSGASTMTSRLSTSFVYLVVAVLLYEY